MIAGSLQPPSPSTTIWVGSRVVEQRQHRLGRRRRPEPDHELGQVRVAPRPGPDQVVGVAQDVRPVVRPAADPRQRVGEDRVAVAAASRASAAGRPGSSCGRPGSGRARRRQRGREPVERRRRRARPRPDDAGVTARAHSSASIRPRAARARHQRLAEPDVEVDRPGRPPRAVATARPDDRPDVPPVSGAPSSSGSSANQRTCRRRSGPGRSSAAPRDRAARAADPRSARRAGRGRATPRRPTAAGSRPPSPMSRRWRPAGATPAPARARRTRPTARRAGRGRAAPGARASRGPAASTGTRDRR